MDEQQLQLKIVDLVQKAMQGDQQANQQIKEIMLAAQQGNLEAALIAQMIQQAVLQMQGSVYTAKFGAKLNYIKFLRGKCPNGYEMQYFKKGGAICKKCVKKMQKGEEGLKTSEDTVKAFRCGRKMKKTKKKACGGNLKEKK